MRLFRWLTDPDRRVLKQGVVDVHCFHRRWPKDEWEATASYAGTQFVGRGPTAEAARDNWCAQALVDAARRSCGEVR